MISPPDSPVTPSQTSSTERSPEETPLQRRLRVQRDVEEKAAQYRLYMKTSAAGLEFGLSIVMGVLLGYVADRYFQSSPLGLFIGLGFGLAAGVRTLYRLTKNSLAEDDDTSAVQEAPERPREETDHGP